MTAASKQAIDIASSRRDGEAVVAVTGELDVAGAPNVRRALFDEMADGVDRLTVDLSGLSFIDSTGLGVLVGAYKRARAHEIGFRVTRPSRAVARVFEIAGLDKVLPIEVTADIEP